MQKTLDLALPSSGIVTMRAAGSTVGRSSLLDGLVSYWKLDEASGTRYDAHGVNHLASNNAVTQSAGKLSGAARFNIASSQFLSHADNADLSTGDIDFTFCAWVNPATIPGTNMCVVGKDDQSGSNREYRLFVGATTGVPSFLVMKNNLSSAQANWGSGISASTWSFLVAWHGSVGNNVYVQVNNGTPVAASYSGGAADSTAPFSIGCYNTDQWFFNGSIDGVGFWKRVLTAEERDRLFNYGVGLDYPF